MFLEMVKDMPRGRADSLARLAVPIAVVMVVGLVVLAVWLVGDAREARDLESQVERQAETAGVLFPQGYDVPPEGDRPTVLLMDGAMADGIIRVDDGVATLLVVDEDGTPVPVTAMD